MYFCKSTIVVMKEKNAVRIQHYHSPCGELMIGSFEKKLCLCDWVAAKHRDRVDKRLKRLLQADYKEEMSEVLQKACRQLDEYSMGNEPYSISLYFLLARSFRKEYGWSFRRFPMGRLFLTEHLPNCWANQNQCAL